MVEAICKEIELRKDFFGSAAPLQTLYFGGGTPGLLSGAELAPIFESLAKHFSFADNPEITLEANPDDLSPERLREFKNLGVNRLSIGIQSFREEDLRLLRRVHDARQARKCVENARSLGFDDLSIDLIYGIPGLTAEAWAQNLEIALQLQLPHISAYALTVEPRTLLAGQVAKKQLQMPEDPQFEQQFFALIDSLCDAGYAHYEISNFALPGRQSRHNSSYWKGEAYLGLGPSAHSFQGATRSWNLKPNTRYLHEVEMGMIPVEDQERLSNEDKINEAIMTRLRLQEGIHLPSFEEEFGYPLGTHAAAAIQEFRQKGWLKSNPEAIVLSREGKMLSDHIIAELFV